MKKIIDYKYYEEIDTRFSDNDVFGHLNNIIYYSLFDSVINRFLIKKCGYDPITSDTIAVSPETRCVFKKSFKYPEKILAGLSTSKIGKTSIIYDIALFGIEDNIARAEGYFVHVFVKRKKRNEKIIIPEKIRKELNNISF